jgi:hypothetical protein
MLQKRSNIAVILKPPQNIGEIADQASADHRDIMFDFIVFSDFLFWV